MLDVQKIQAAINLIAAEKKLPKQKLVEIIEAALKTAYKKDFGNKDEEVNVHFDLESGELEISVEKTVKKIVEDPNTEISFEDLGDDAGDFEEGDVIEIDVTDEVLAKDGDIFGRIASQAARQVIIQKVADSEKEKIYDLFVGKEGEVVNMRVDMVEGGKVVFDYNGNQVTLPKSEQVSRDSYVADNRLYLYIAEVSREENSLPKVVLSRKRAELVPAIFAEYVPEIAEGVVTIDAVVRHAGVKTKLLVSSTYEEIDPAGTLIGQKGMRVKAVMEELSGEKIDIIPNSDDIRDIISRSLTPATVVRVEEGDDEDSFIAYIPYGERAKAVGRGGINVHLASELTGVKISIEELEQTEEQKEQEQNDQTSQNS
ncbi:transcription termination factor NusA [Candidatus Gracilibacteria bacterium]|nr:transcription termination factor NusA [Candidatus Gracilibacteria bacterium]